MLPLQVLTVILVAVVMGMALAHALEYPGKMRLQRHDYLVTQSIYYPGFTVGGASEPLGIAATLLLLILTPHDNPAFWWTAAALLAMAATHAVFWAVTQPVNRYWVGQLRLTSAAQKFFSVEENAGQGSILLDRWEGLRNRWEYSHITRAVLAATGLITLTVAVATYRTR